MSVDPRPRPSSATVNTAVLEPDDDIDAPATWGEIVVTVAMTIIAVSFVSFVAVVMGMA